MKPVLAIFLAMFATLGADESCFSDLIVQRHSGYAFNAEKNVAKSDLIKLANAARSSPSSHNQQPWMYIFCDRVATPEAYKKALDCVAPSNQKWAKDAPVLVITLTKTINSKNQTNKWAQYDTGAASMSLVYMTTALGLMAHEMAGFDADKVRKEFDIPSDVTPMVIIAIGYEKDGETPLRRGRNPLPDQFFWGSLSNGLSE